MAQAVLNLYCLCGFRITYSIPYQFQLVTLHIDATYKFTQSGIQMLHGESPIIGETWYKPEPNHYYVFNIALGSEYIGYVANRYVASANGQRILQNGLFVSRHNGEDQAYFPYGDFPKWFPDGYHLLFMSSNPKQSIGIYAVDIHHPNDAIQITYAEQFYSITVLFTSLRNNMLGLSTPNLGLYIANVETPCIIY